MSKRCEGLPVVPDLIRNSDSKLNEKRETREGETGRRMDYQGRPAEEERDPPSGYVRLLARISRGMPLKSGGEGEEMVLGRAKGPGGLKPEG